MDGLVEDIINGVGDEDRILEEMLRTEEQRLTPHVQVIQTPKGPPSKLIVHIPTLPSGKPDASRATITKVAVLPNGDFKTLEHPRPLTSSERSMVATGKKEVLSSPMSAVETVVEKEDRPWWHYAVGLASVGVVVGGGWYVKQKFWPKENPAAEEEETDEDDDYEDDEDEE